ncbi:MAG: acetyl-CoA acetyltransferase [Myxococcales bacterium]|nr:acetyl-CoA acetyltransferase [Myxococcales bacterium]
MSQPSPERTPVIVGVGQVTERSEVTSAIALAERACRRALDEAPGLRERVERITVVAISFSRSVPDPARELASRLGIEGALAELSSHGGNMPQYLVSRAAADIAAGKLRSTLIAGAEATRSLRLAEPDVNFLDLANANVEVEKSGKTIGPTLDGILGKAEIRAGLNAPSTVYPMFESVLAKRAGRSHAEQRAAIAPLMSRFTEVAARNPYAWFPKAQSAAEIAEVSGANRLISEPYNRSMNSFPNVDQGAALLLTNLAVARELGLADACVFPWAGAAAKELPPAQRPDLGDSAAMTSTSRAALTAAGVAADDCAHIDLYSCFPVAVEVAAAGLGIDPAGDRELTVTGGLPYFGGPGNNYSTHAIASLVERIRETGELGFVSANGGYMSKHAAGVYGGSPPAHGFVAADQREAQARIDASALPVVLEAEGAATVAAATVSYGRDGGVVAAPVIATFDDGRRIAARAAAEVAPELAGRNLVGERIAVSGSRPEYRPL